MGPAAPHTPQPCARRVCWSWLWKACCAAVAVSAGCSSLTSHHRLPTPLHGTESPSRCFPARQGHIRQTRHPVLGEHELPSLGGHSGLILVGFSCSAEPQQPPFPFPPRRVGTGNAPSLHCWLLTPRVGLRPLRWLLAVWASQAGERFKCLMPPPRPKPPWWSVAAGVGRAPACVCNGGFPAGARLSPPSRSLSQGSCPTHARRKAAEGQVSAPSSWGKRGTP